MKNIWIFQLKEALSPSGLSAVEHGLNAMLASWNAHGTPVPGSAEVRYDRFIIIHAAPGTTSGCSIDSMNASVHEAVSSAGAEVLGAEYIFYKTPDDRIGHVHFKDAPQLVASGALAPETVIFDSTLGHSNDLGRWEIALAQSWLSRHLPQVV